MKVARIELNSPAEVEKEFADVVFFQGCTRSCVYCFNPELQEKGGFDHEMDVKEIAQYVYNSFSSVIVLTGGEPLDQDKTELLNLISYMKACNKKIVLETSKYDKDIYNAVTHVIYCIKTNDVNESALNGMENMKHVTKIVITDHEGFSFDGYINALAYMNGIIYYRPANDRLLGRKWANLYQLAKKYKIELKRWKKICLTKKNSMN